MDYSAFFGLVILSSNINRQEAFFQSNWLPAEQVMIDLSIYDEMIQADLTILTAFRVSVLEGARSPEKLNFELRNGDDAVGVWKWRDSGEGAQDTDMSQYPCPWSGAKSSPLKEEGKDQEN